MELEQLYCPKKGPLRQVIVKGELLYLISDFLHLSDYIGQNVTDGVKL